MDDAVKLCKDCRHYRAEGALELGARSCRHQMNLRTDYVNGGVAVRNSADFLRSDGNRCGHEGKWWEEK